MTEWFESPAVATVSFNSLSCIWPDISLPKALRLQLYLVRVTTVLLYVCESWNLTQAVKGKLRGFHGGRLAKILKTTQREAIGDKTLPCIVKMARKRRWLWLGHILRMGNNRTLRMVFDTTTPRQPPYPPWTPMAEAPWGLEEAERRAMDHKKWAEIFDAIL
jgi:hypothetical protein